MAIGLPTCPTLGDLLVALLLVVTFIVGSLLGARPETLAAVSDAISTALDCS